MNKYQEAIMILNTVPLNDEKNAIIRAEATDNLQELINKTVPVKIQTEAKVITGNGLTMVKPGGYCPACENYPHPDEVFCGYCGQALDIEPRKVGLM